MRPDLVACYSARISLGTDKSYDAIRAAGQTTLPGIERMGAPAYTGTPRPGQFTSPGILPIIRIRIGQIGGSRCKRVPERELRFVPSAASSTQSRESSHEQDGPFGTSRRALFIGGASLITAAGLAPTFPAGKTLAASTQSLQQRNSAMGTLTTKDGTEIYYNDWGAGQPIVFSHGWPLSADAFEDQMFFLASHGYRCIAHDRRGHGRSSQPWQGNDLDTYADDLAALVEKLDLRNAIHIGHSTGGGEVTRYIGRHGNSRVAKAVLIGAIPPLMLKTAANPGGTPIGEFDKLRAAVLADRSQFWKDLSLPFYGYNRPGAKISEGVRESFWLQGMMAGFPASYFCIKAFSETDLTEDLKRIEVPTLVMHGDDDQIVPIEASALLSAKLIKNATLRVIKGAPHGLCTTLKDQVNEELLGFIRG
jgi:non-heme chloroperoxidase